MENESSKRRKNILGRLTSLVILVAFVFAILLVSIVVAAVLLFVLIGSGLMPTVSENNLLVFLVFLLLTSLGIGTVLAGFGGTVMVRPMRQLSDATKEVAAGNYAVRVKPSGPFEAQRLAENFNEMAKELGSVETLRSDFVSNISHEFKTPVVSIRGFAKLLKKKNLPEEKRDEYLDIIISEADRMAQLSGNVLLLSKLDSTERLPEAEAYPLDEQLRRAALMMEGEFSKKSIALDVDLQPVSIVANQEFLQHIWLNLLGNAVKFTPENGRVFIGLTSANGSAAVTVADTGIGMEPDVQAHLFDKFYQGDSSRATEGNGLGLSLAKRIVDLMGGTIAVTSAPGEGSAFCVTLPIALPAA